MVTTTPITYPCFVQKKDSFGKWHWTYYGPEGEEVAHSARAFTDRADCLAYIRMLQDSHNDPVFFVEHTHA